jgi:hypothetical protein
MNNIQTTYQSIKITSTDLSFGIQRSWSNNTFKRKTFSTPKHKKYTKQECIDNMKVLY